MSEVKARVRVFGEETLFADVTATIDRDNRGISVSTLPLKEFSIIDDMLSVSDAASFTISNANGVNSGKFVPGQRVEIDEQDPAVAGGQWIRMFTGRVTQVQYGSDISGGSTVLVSAMDLGWHLTSCDAPPLLKTSSGTIETLIKNLIDPSWGFASTAVSGPEITDNVLNRRLKQGRQGAARAFVPPKTILPFIQVEPGQKPFDILRTYLTREGLLLNVGARGNLLLFRPDYREATPYTGVEYHADGRRTRNNIVGRPTLAVSIDGLYSRTECWSTSVRPTKVQETAIANNPNAAYLRKSYEPVSNPLPFERLSIVMDGEAITAAMRENRAIHQFQMGAFNSWRYEVDLQGHSQKGTFLTSDSMIPINDSVHGVNGTYYVQSVRRSMTLGQGERSHLVLRKPLIDPTLQQQLGGGARQAAR